MRHHARRMGEVSWKPGKMRVVVGEREGVVDPRSPTVPVLRPSVGNDEYRPVTRGGYQTGSMSLSLASFGDKKPEKMSRNDGYLWKIGVRA